MSQGFTQQAPTSGTSYGVTGGAYHPDREPSSGLDTSRSDSFNGGAQITWTAFNSPTAGTYTYDAAQLTRTTETTNLRGYYMPGGAISSDFSVYTKQAFVAGGNYGTAGIVFLHNGTWAAPTALAWGGTVYDSTNLFGAMYLQTRPSYSGFTANIAIHGYGAALIAATSMYLWMKYVASTKALSFYYSGSGTPGVWRLLASITLTNHPEVGRFIDAGNGGVTISLETYFWRVFVSGVNGATAAQYGGGQMGS